MNEKLSISIPRSVYLSSLNFLASFESHLTAKQLDGKFGKSHTVSKISEFRLDMDNKMPGKMSLRKGYNMRPLSIDRKETRKCFSATDKTHMT